MKFLVFAVLCVATVSCLEVENICTYRGLFDYNGLRVNTFHRVQWNMTFESLSHYLINDSVKCDPAEFKNKTCFWEALKLKNVL